MALDDQIIIPANVEFGNSAMDQIGFLSKTSNQTISANTTADVTWTNQVIAPPSDFSHSTSTNPAEITANYTGNFELLAEMTYDPEPHLYWAANQKIQVSVDGTIVKEILSPVYDDGGTYVLQPVRIHYCGPVASGKIIKIRYVNAHATQGGDILGRNSAIERCTCSIRRIS